MYDNGGIITSAQRQTQPARPMVSDNGLGSGLAAQQAQGKLSLKEELSLLTPEQRAVAIQDLLGQQELYGRGQVR